MAVVIGPLHSQSASGQLGKTLIYQPSRGQNVVKAYGKPNWITHPATAPQLAVQAFTKLIMEHWEVIPTVKQATWDALAEPANISRVNAYLIENWRRHRGDEPLLDGFPDIYASLVAAVAQFLTEEPELDVLGDYYRIADYNGMKAYKQPSGYVGYIWYDAIEGDCLLSNSLGIDHESADYYRAGADPEGNWSPRVSEGDFYFHEP
jgi:hypothetical protein